MTCSTDDLMSVMQTLLNERRKTKALQKKVAELQGEDSETLSYDIKQKSIEDDLSSLEELKKFTQAITPKPAQEAPVKPIQEVKPEVKIAEPKKDTVHEQTLLELRKKEEEAKFKDNEILKLKSHIQQLSEKPVELPTPVKVIEERPLLKDNFDLPPPNPLHTTQVRHDLYAAQSELKVAREKNSALDEEMKRLKAYVQTLQTELKEQGAKNLELSRGKEELLKLKAAVGEQTGTIDEARQETRRYKHSLQELQEKLFKQNQELFDKENEVLHLKKKIEQLSQNTSTSQLVEQQMQELQLLKSENHRLKSSLKELERQIDDQKNASVRVEQQLEDKKLLYAELLAQKKEFESKIAALHSEKHSYLARVNELHEQNMAQDTLYKQLNHEKDLLKQALTQESKAKEDEKTSASQKAILLQQKAEELLELQRQVEGLKKTLAMLSQEKETHEKEVQTKEKEIQELEQEVKKVKLLLQKSQEQEEEQKNQVSLLEQHLSRRVRECALLNKAQEEQANEMDELRVKLAELQKKIAELTQIELESAKKHAEQHALLLKKSSEFEEELSRKDEEYETLYKAFQEQSHHLNELQVIEEKFLQMKELFGHFGKIVEAPFIQPQPPAIKYGSTPSTFEEKIPSKAPTTLHTRAKPYKAPPQTDLFQEKSKSSAPVRTDMFQ